MDELLTQFLIEGRDLVAGAEADLGRLARDPGDTAALDSLFRAFHTLKGSVGLFDMAPAEALLHRAEDDLGAARKTGTPLTADRIDTLLASVDAVDRWIDELERDGRIGADATDRAERLIARLGGGEAIQAEHAVEQGYPNWLASLQARFSLRIAAAEGALIAFRYTPDADCFFRGDDPLALAAAVPDLVDIAILPRGDWPALDHWDPFRCHAIIEGISAAPIDAVRTAFRLVPDQIAVAALPVAQADTGSATDRGDGARLVRVEGARLDALAADVGELVVAANGLSHATRLAERLDPDLASTLRAVQGDIDRISGRLHQAVAAVRRVSLAASLRRLPRLVREIADSLGKPVHFAMRGESTEVDKAIAENLFEPVLHIVRNALDHGLESPVQRRAAGKPEKGHIAIDVIRQGDEVVVGISDDGVGIDPDAMRASAVARGTIDAAQAAALSDAQALRLIFAAGFSTAAEITDLSGRGVGMDAVQNAVERLRGRVVIESRVGEGTRIELRLPLDAITTRLLVVRAGEDRYGVRFDQIVETARIDARDIMTVGTGVACVLRERTVPVLDLSTLLGGAETADDTARLLLTESAGEQVAIRVTAFDMQMDALVRQTEGLLAALPGVAGTALLDDGGVLLVLDLPELVG